MKPVCARQWQRLYMQHSHPALVSNDYYTNCIITRLLDAGDLGARVEVQQLHKSNKRTNQYCVL